MKSYLAVVTVHRQDTDGLLQGQTDTRQMTDITGQTDIWNQTDIIGEIDLQRTDIGGTDHL